MVPCIFFDPSRTHFWWFSHIFLQQKHLKKTCQHEQFVALVLVHSILLAIRSILTTFAPAGIRWAHIRNDIRDVWCDIRKTINKYSPDRNLWSLNHLIDLSITCDRSDWSNGRISLLMDYISMHNATFFWMFFLGGFQATSLTHQLIQGGSP